METNSKDQDHINQLIGQSPSWMLRWGILLVSCFFILLAILSWFIQYPDVLTADAKLHTVVLPVQIKMPIQGQIDTLLVPDKSAIRKGDLLAVLNNTAVYSDVLEAEVLVQNWTASANRREYPNNLQLGVISDHWADFNIHQKEFNYSIQNDFTVLKSQNTQKQIVQLEALNTAFSEQKATLQEAYDFAKKSKDEIDGLSDKGASNPQEIEQATMTYLRAKQFLEQHTNKIITNQLEIQQLQGNLLEVSFAQKKARSGIVLQIQKDIQHIKSAITVWKQNNLIYAPISGEMTVLENWTYGQQLVNGFPFLSIVPGAKINPVVLATAYVADTGFGKIQLHSDVQIQLNAYPYYEFGTLEGTVQEIPPIVENGFYLVKIKLEKPLTTTYGKEIIFQPNMKGMARITTKKRRLAERLFDRIRNVQKN